MKMISIGVFHLRSSFLASKCVERRKLLSSTTLSRRQKSAKPKMISKMKKKWKTKFICFLHFVRNRREMQKALSRALAFAVAAIRTLKFHLWFLSETFSLAVFVTEHQAAFWCVGRKGRKNKNDLIFRRLMMEYKILRVRATRNYGYIKYSRKRKWRLWTRLSASGCRFNVSFRLILDLFRIFLLT